jgi:hypothetical protein
LGSAVHASSTPLGMPTAIGAVDDHHAGVRAAHHLRRSWTQLVIKGVVAHGSRRRRSFPCYWHHSQLTPGSRWTLRRRRQLWLFTQLPGDMERDEAALVTVPSGTIGGRP